MIDENIEENEWCYKNVRLVKIIGEQIEMIMKTRRDIDAIEERLRCINMEIRGDMRAGKACCMNPDVEITIDPMQVGEDGLVCNCGVYNNYTCKNCGKVWREMVSRGFGGGYVSISDIQVKEIGDYHNGYIKKPKLRCPVCHNAGLHVFIVNEDKKTHHYEVHCLNCRWKSDDLKHSWGRLQGKEKKNE